ncbi:MAG: hypothetical protein ABR970_12280 [Roseiarcus sp.]|jgi:hypothetical protein
MDKKLLGLTIAVAAVVVIAAGAGFLPFRRAAAPTADAVTIMGVAQRLAVFPGLTDAAALSAAFGMTFDPPGEGTRQTNCAGAPVQASRRWRSSAAGDWWFRADAQGLRRRPVFVLQVESQPAACPTDWTSRLVDARFINAHNWRCVRLADFGALAADFKTTYQGPNGVHVLVKRVDRPDGRAANLQIDFGAADSGECLYSMGVTIPNI